MVFHSKFYVFYRLFMTLWFLLADDTYFPYEIYIYPINTSQYSFYALKTGSLLRFYREIFKYLILKFFDKYKNRKKGS